jgi:hypothetical protein
MGGGRRHKPPHKTSQPHRNLKTIRERDQNGNVLAHYSLTLNVDELLAESRSGTTSFYEQDGLGVALLRC